MDLIILGFIIGLLVSILIVVTLMFFKKPVENKISVIEKQISKVAPRPKGFIVEPENESDEFRDKIIRENKEKGLDTPIKDLI